MTRSNVAPDDPGLRPDLAGTTLELPPGKWWSADGWLRMEIIRVGDTGQRELPEGWVWVVGDVRDGNQPGQVWRYIVGVGL